MASARRTAPLALAAAATLFGATFAPHAAFAAGEAKACVEAATQYQALRKQSRLVDAREKLLVCTQPKCPKPVLKDCTKWLEEVDAAIPTLVFRAKSDRGGDLVDVKVLVDAKEVATSLDGKPIVVEPGVHTVRMEAPDHASEESKVVVSEGEKARSIVVTLRSTKPLPVDETGPKAAPRGHTVLPWVVVGVGAAAAGAGAFFLLTRPGLPAACDKARVDRLASNQCAAGTPQSDLDAAKKHDDYGTAGIVALSVGGAAIVGGLVWHFVEPTDHGGSEKSAPEKEKEKGIYGVSPFFAPGTGGATVFGRF
jgi:hypothetical protein